MSPQRIWVRAPGVQSTSRMRRIAVGRLSDYPEIQRLTIANVRRTGSNPHRWQVAVVTLNRFLPRAAKRELELWMRRVLEVTHVRFESPCKGPANGEVSGGKRRLLLRVQHYGRPIFERNSSGTLAA